jgi:hypothetical protein
MKFGALYNKFGHCSNIATLPWHALPPTLLSLICQVMLSKITLAPVNPINNFARETRGIA